MSPARIIRSSPMTYVTPRTIRKISPVTGRMQTYIQTVTNLVIQPAPSLNPNTLVSEVNTQLTASQTDAFCDQVVLVHGALSTEVQSSVWGASESPLAPVIIAAIIMALAIAFVVVGLALITTSFLAELAHLVAGYQPQYWNPQNPDQPFTTWSEYLTYQHAHYWLVCPKCGAGFASKSQYPLETDVPQDVKDMYNDHVASCLGIPQTGTGGWMALLPFVIAAPIIVVSIWALVKIVTGHKEPYIIARG